ncbi:TonB-dependent receptor domain-containing protein [Stigmatella aurantiaca]|uniref:TonB-dependent receptor n=1 Tax=Stigmatella aurantiaca (strain DW4/3-1) TaxID=378806 RepID=Q099G0_STIAD|nr:TonB-dependent receptor [Stigmatella aurantiaca]ADO75608.1 TonB-dependent receptor [Stigmatella aurantiaca DW4/3-1]EAU68378.1 probable tonb-dependent receptor signal peptide protein, putative [Stigmatella aurantiaca DW4/3-1]
MIWFRPAVLLLLPLLLLPSLALANNTADEADVAFELGNEAYARGNYNEALSAYFTSYRLVPNRNVLFNIARCYEAQNRLNEAYRYYDDLSNEALSSDDAAEVRRSLERLRPRVALVRVTTIPEGAEVYIDRTDLGSRGRSPQTLALPPGRHKVMVKKEGYQPAEATVYLARGKPVSQEIELTLITGLVELTGTPEGAEVRNAPDGPVLTEVPGRLRLPPGQHLLYVRAPGHAPAQLVAEVTADATVKVPVALRTQEKPTGRLVVTANRDNASVRVDGQPVGFTPTVLTLPEGEHTLEVESLEVRPLRKQVTVVAEQEVKVHAELRYIPPPVRAASKGLLSVDEAPASTTVLSQEELRAFGWRTLAEALSGVRGFFLVDDRNYTHVGVRGFSPPGDLNTRLLILWDGHALNDVWAGQGYAAHDLSVDLEEVERIEVVRGPGSALYGTGAFFAVINVVPRESLGTRRAELTGAVGALGTTRVHATSGWDNGTGRSVLFSAAGMHARGADTTPLGTGVRVVGLDGERAGTASLRARLGHLTLMAQLHGRRKDIPTGASHTVIGAEGTQVQDVRGFAEARYERPLGARVSLSLRGSLDLSRYRGYWMYDEGVEGSPLTRDTDAGQAEWLSAEARVLLNLFAGNDLTLGLEGQHQLRIEQEVFGGEGLMPLNKRTLLSLYLLDEWRLHPRLSLSVGIRVDRYSDLDTTPFTPRLAFIGRPYAVGLTKLVVGRAFRAPNAYELFYEDRLVTQRPALQLDPETITTFELEHSHDLTDELRLTLAGYHNRISNLVTLELEQLGTPQCGAPTGTEQCLVYRNTSGETLAWGAEAGIHWQPGRYLLVDLSYSYVTLHNASDEVQSVSPAHIASGRLLLPLSGGELRLATQATYQSARKSSATGPSVGEAVLVSFGVSGDLARFRYFAGVQNLLDERYALPVSNEISTEPVPQYGRTFTLQLTGAF